MPADQRFKAHKRSRLKIYDRLVNYPKFFPGHRSAQVGLNTNGLLLTEKLCEHLVRAGLGSLVVSIDGMESNEPIRGVPYEELRDKVVLLDAVKKRLGAKLPYLGVAYTLMRGNLAELPRLLADLLPRVKLEAFHVQPLIVFYETMKDENIYLEPTAALTRERNVSATLIARASAAMHLIK